MRPEEPLTEILDLTEITCKEDAMDAWDGDGVIVREEDGYVYVYPLLGRGYIYPEFDLRRECNLMGFAEVEQAILWAKSKGYAPCVIGG